MHVREDDLHTQNKKGLCRPLISAPTFELMKWKHCSPSSQEAEMSRYLKAQRLAQLCLQKRHPFELMRMSLVCRSQEVLRRTLNSRVRDVTKDKDEAALRM